jgi:diguanylate cyclase (GGDEF)-like protein
MFQGKGERQGRILVIDDDPFVGRLVKRLLERKGHCVDAVRSGEEGLQRIVNVGYDIVITDIKLPNMDGMAVLDRIREVNTETDVIVITGFGSIESAVSFMKAGALDYIGKPINGDYLEIVVEKAIERKELIKASRERDLYLRLALTDALTGLFNQRYFHEHLAREIVHSRRTGNDLSVMILDIDNFKKVNDRHGHQVGNMVLQKLSSVLLKACRVHDTIARYGGEEFGIILPDTGIQKAEYVAGRILEHTSSHQYPPVDWPVTVSIGIAGYPAHAQHEEELIQKADTALYRSKESGKNRLTVFTEETERRAGDHTGS